MLTSGSELPLLAIKTGKDERLSTSSRHLSRKNSFPHSSIEVYYGGASQSVAIPFGWESQPGTPKVVFRETPLPPLTPPPSFLLNLNPPQTPVKKQSRPKSSLLYTVLPKLTPNRKTHSPASPASPASYSSSSSPGSLSHSGPSSPYLQGEAQFLSARSSFESRSHKEDGFGSTTPLPKEDELDSPVSTLCFGIRRGTNTRSRGCSPRIITVLLGEL